MADKKSLTTIFVLVCGVYWLIVWTGNRIKALQPCPYQVYLVLFGYFQNELWRLPLPEGSHYANFFFRCFNLPIFPETLICDTLYFVVECLELEILRDLLHCALIAKRLAERKIEHKWITLLISHFWKINSSFFIKAQHYIHLCLWGLIRNEQENDRIKCRGLAILLFL